MWFELPDPCKDAITIQSHLPPINVGTDHAIFNPYKAFGEGKSGLNEKYREWLCDNSYLLRHMRQRMTGRSVFGLDLSPSDFEELAIYADLTAGKFDSHIRKEPVLAFFSTLDGNHARGFAVEGRCCYGAEHGHGRGMSGHSYAIPAMDDQFAFLPLGAILEELDMLFSFAGEHPERNFRLAHLPDFGQQLDLDAIEDHCVAGAPENLALPRSWLFKRGAIPPRVVIAGSAAVTTYSAVDDRLDTMMCRLDHPTIISTGNRGASLLGERYAIERSLKLERFPAPWHRFKVDAEEVRNDRLAWEATHLVALWDSVSLETKSLISVCRRCRIPTRVSMP